jgi:hypothetical protein
MLDPPSQKSSILYLKCTEPLTSRQKYVHLRTPSRFSRRHPQALALTLSL